MKTSKSLYLNMPTPTEHKARPLSAYTTNNPIPFVINTRQNTSKSIIYTMPTQSKGMGAKIEKEQLYEQTMHLKKQNNKLKAELDEARSTIVKKDIELRKKEKIIEDLSKENDIQIVQEENFSKAKESTLVTLCKRKYYEMKGKYEKAEKEKEILKANIKLTKIKEIKIEKEVIEKELEKIKNLYMHVYQQNQNNLNEIEQLQEYQKQFMVQHQLITGLKESFQNAKEESKCNKEELSKTKDKLSKKEASNKKLQLEVQKLKSQMEKYLNEKKNKELSVIHQRDYKEKLQNALKELNTYKQRSSYVQPETKQPTTNMQYHVVTSVAHDTQKEIDDKDRKIDLLESIIKDSFIKLNIYEDYIIKHGGNPSKILKNKKYDGVINKLNAHLAKEPKGTNRPETYNTNSTNNQTEVQVDQKYIIDPQSIDNKYFSDFRNVFKFFKIVFEGNKITCESCIRAINEIYKQFEDQEEASKEDFMFPFINLFNQCTKASKEEEMKFITDFINNYLENTNNDTNTFFDTMQNFANSVIDYSAIANEKEIIEQLKLKFTPVKEDLIKYLQYNQSSDNQDLIDWMTFHHIMKTKIQIDITEELFDYILFKMRENLPDNTSIFLLNYGFIIALLNGNIIEEMNYNNNNNEKLQTDSHISEKAYEENENQSVNKSKSKSKSEYQSESVNFGEDKSVEHISSLENYEVDKSNLNKELGRIFSAMVYNCTPVFKFFEDDIEIDSVSKGRVIHSDKFFEKLKTLNLNLSEKEIKDFKKQYRLEHNKNMLDIDKIQSNFNNVKIEQLPITFLDDVNEQKEQLL